MSTVKSGDMIAVYRGSTLYHAPADMSTVQDTDLILVQRGKVPHKCTFADWKASQVPPAGVNKPALLTPADGATDVGDTPTFTSTAFAITGTGITHASSDWQVTLNTDTGFASPVVQSMADATNLVSWSGGPLQPDTDYIARVRHNGSGGLQSPWSDVIGFKTTASFSDFIVTPGDLWAAGTAVGQGTLKTNPVKMVAVVWGDTGLALGVDGKVYKCAPAATFQSMTPVITPPDNWVAICDVYAGNCVAGLSDSGKIYHADLAGTQGAIWGYSLHGGVKAKSIRTNPEKDSGGFALGDDGNIYRSSTTTLASTSYAKVTGNTKLFTAFSLINTKLWGLSADGKLWEYDYDTNNFTAPLVNETEVTGGPFTSVHTNYEQSAVAAKSDKTLKYLDANTVARYPASLPAGFDLVDVALGYFNMFASSSDGRIIVSGNASRPEGPYIGGIAPSNTVWAEYDLPRPCAGLGASKYTGSGYTFAFILP